MCVGGRKCTPWPVPENSITGYGVSIDSMLIMLAEMPCWGAIGLEVSQVDFIQVACLWQMETEGLLFPPMENLLL